MTPEQAIKEACECLTGQTRGLSPEALGVLVELAEDGALARAWRAGVERFKDAEKSLAAIDEVLG